MTTMTLRLAMLGDSVAFGTGATRAQDTLGARLTTALANSGTSAEYRVFAIPGAISRDLAGQVDQAELWGSDVAVIVIGANDLTRLVPPERAADQLGRAVRGLRRTGTEVVVSPAPDLSVVRFVPPALRDVLRSASRILRELQTSATLAEGGRLAVTDSAAAEFAKDPTLFSLDTFHPSSAGYALIALALAPAVCEAARDAVAAAG